MVSDETNRPRRRSSSAEAASLRWRQAHPDEDLDHDAPSRIPEPEGEVPGRHSASAEAASLRWRERHPDEDD
jgi:hypothetical protein